LGLLAFWVFPVFEFLAFIACPTVVPASGQG
jgi:hypothetical protein